MALPRVACLRCGGSVDDPGRHVYCEHCRRGEVPFLDSCAGMSGRYATGEDEREEDAEFEAMGDLFNLEGLYPDP